MDNLNTHKDTSRGPFVTEWSRLHGERFEFHYTPKHASWLNAAEIEINVMDTECTGKRIESREKLAMEVSAWTARRNEKKKKINWKFTRKKADRKLSKYYV